MRAFPSIFTITTLSLVQIAALSVRGASAFVVPAAASKAFLFTQAAQSANAAVSRKRTAGAPRMLFTRMFGGTPAPDPATNLAAKPALSKVKTEDEWKQILSPTALKVLRRKATEPRKVDMAKGGWDDHTAKGTYVCTGCKTPLYTSAMKFDCGCGWPGFWTNIKDAVYEKRDFDGFRCEILCSECDGHLGHVFRNEYFGNPPPDERHCVNSVSVAFIPEGKDVVQPCTYEGPVYE